MIPISIKTAWRALRKSRSFGILNIAGLAIGIASAGMILLWVEDEVTFNRSFAHYDRIYQVMENLVYNGGLSTMRVTPGPLSDALKAEVPGIKRSARSGGSKQALVMLGDRSIYQEGSHVDPAFLSMFSLEFVRGDAAHAFDQLHAMVITEKMAATFFGNADAIGQTLKMNNDVLYTVTGVVKELPANSFMRFDWLAPYAVIENSQEWLKDWGSNGVFTYVELDAQDNKAAVGQQLLGYLKTKKDKLDTQLFLFPMAQWHLYDHFTNGVQDGQGKIKYVRLFSLIAGLILVIACINFMNLATARSEQRAKEVGVRKTLGAQRGGLARQFILEALMMSGAAVVLAVGLIYVLLPFFNTWVAKALQLHLSDPLHVGGLAAIACLTGLIAGSYPAFYLSSFHPALVLKGWKTKSAGKAALIRQGLVTGQFVVSITLIVCTIIIYQQIQYTKTRHLGYAKDALLTIPVRGQMQNGFEAIKMDLIGTGYVENVTLSVSPIYSAGWFSSDNYTWPGKDPSKDLMVNVDAVTPEYVSTMGLRLLEGRDFYPNAKSDENSVLINRTLARQLGDGNVIGMVITQNNGRPNPWQRTVVGVVDDFVYGDMFSASPMPMIFICNTVDFHQMTLHIKDNADIPAMLTEVERIVKAHNPEYPFEYRFVNDEFDKLFKNEALVEKLAGVFALLAILISCLGLYGLAAYTASRRMREISIRKVLGASVQGLMGLLSKDFLKLVALACGLSFPAAWYIMREWLRSYDYKTPVEWWVFLSTGAVAMIIALVTVSFQTLKAAWVNPADKLKE